MGVFRKEERGGLLGIVFCCLISSSMFFKRLRQFACCGLLLCAGLAGAAEVAITAAYHAGPGNYYFTDTTVWTGKCTVYPADCSRGGNNGDARRSSGSFKTPMTAVSETGFSKSEISRSVRMGPFFNLFNEPRTVRLTNEATGSIRQVEFALLDFGGTYVLSQPVSGYQGHARLWADRLGRAGGWDMSGAGCASRWPNPPYTDTEFSFSWRKQGSACYKLISEHYDDIPGPFRYKDLEFYYSMRTPDSEGMDAGVYKGSLTYVIGSPGGFDLGDKMIASDSVIRVNFELTVNTALKVDFPPGSNRAILQPLRGWQAWLNSGRNPPALSASHGFKISGSGPFKVYLRCDIQMGLSCGIQGQGVAAKGILVAPVDIAVTFPPSIVQTPGNRPAIKVPLKSGVVNAATFNISGLQKTQSATIHYDVAAEQTALMVESPGSTYQGIVTLIFDAAL